MAALAAPSPASSVRGSLWSSRRLRSALRAFAGVKGVDRFAHLIDERPTFTLADCSFCGLRGRALSSRHQAARLREVPHASRQQRGEPSCQLIPSPCTRSPIPRSPGSPPILATSARCARWRRPSISSSRSSCRSLSASRDAVSSSASGLAQSGCATGTSTTARPWAGTRRTGSLPSCSARWVDCRARSDCSPASSDTAKCSSGRRSCRPRTRARRGPVALAGAEEAKTTWVRLEANTVSKTYDVYRALGDLGDPAWPDMTLQEMVDLAFGGDRTISDPDHPVLRELRGES